ncbi:Uma2 family endonuclease [Litoribacter ruber]|uniref:Uma2 family endonuclease n=1 Tax=Litoribacter ruber TaxID=702568 RepID=A0AAP2CI20_9BACT|nr:MULTISPECIES: Uma2 family endonuclease [Litoribacter]MBS9523646.1 Uma2 family endonuclease [Litoribacter alkaliphilus]MBT0812160.1 Uma2 family endonuclease [Litoribacter ruber]
MKTKGEKNILKEPDASYSRYTYADYLTWEMDSMVELIKGKIFRQAAAPRRIHQEVALETARKLADFLDDKACNIFIAPFDVRLPIKSQKAEDITTVVQPDICVVCDPSKLDDLGCIGAPDLIIEILSPGNNQKELIHKFDIYEECGVKEYWIIHPTEQTLLIYTLTDGKFIPSRLFTIGHTVSSTTIHGFQLDLKDIFKYTEG